MNKMQEEEIKVSLKYLHFHWLFTVATHLRFVVIRLNVFIVVSAYVQSFNLFVYHVQCILGRMQAFR